MTTANGCFCFICHSRAKHTRFIAWVKWRSSRCSLFLISLQQSYDFFVVVHFTHTASLYVAEIAWQFVPYTNRAHSRSATWRDSKHDLKIKPASFGQFIDCCPPVAYCISKENTFYDNESIHWLCRAVVQRHRRTICQNYNIAQFSVPLFILSQVKKLVGFSLLRKVMTQ